MIYNKYMAKINLKNVVWKEGKYHVSWNINTGVSSFGESKKEALKKLEEALRLYFEDVPFSKASKIERPDLVSSVFKHA
jgi:predicted RNase H-like HicB family nuclease